MVVVKAIEELVLRFSFFLHDLGGGGGEGVGRHLPKSMALEEKGGGQKIWCVKEGYSK